MTNLFQAAGMGKDAPRPLADRLRDGAEWLERDGLLKSAELAREAAAELDCLRNVIYYAMNSQK